MYTILLKVIKLRLHCQQDKFYRVFGYHDLGISVPVDSLPTLFFTDKLIGGKV